MRYLIIILLFISSCASQNILITDLNTSGKVISRSNCYNCEGGRYIYKIEIDPVEKSYINYNTNDKYEVGKIINFKTQIY